MWGSGKGGGIMEQNIIQAVSFHQVRLEEGFWKRRIEVNRRVTARVCVDQCEKTHRIDNFRRVSGREKGSFEGLFYNDSDVYKVLEGIAYMLMDHDDPALERFADEIIDEICAAQREDGYLNTYFMLVEPENCWFDMSYHEDYCLGHMVEGAIAYSQATGKDKWLNTAIRAVRQMMSVVGPGKKHWVTGHEELELALVKLYRHTGETAFLRFAEWLVDERGHGYLYTRGGTQPEYCQDHVTARALERVAGHAVRAMYYFSGLADIAAQTGDQVLTEALIRTWRNVVPANYYITGGIGQSAYNEGFTRDWSLPNQTAYCETCAAIGMALWNHRMNLLTGDAKYADIVETEMYNGILSGVSLSGDRFFYDNPLSSVGNHHRRPWYSTSCCPTNIVRFLPSIGGYAYAHRDDTIYVNQYIPGEAAFALERGAVRLTVQTRYPWEGEVSINIDEAPENTFISLRIPGWCGEYSVTRNNQCLQVEYQNGYARLSIDSGDCVILRLSMPVRKEHADPRVQEDAGRVAFARGPIIYCAEACDNPGYIDEYFPSELSVSSSVEPCLDKAGNLPEEVVAIAVGDVTLIPYYMWDNRTEGAMAVWLKEQ